MRYGRNHLFVPGPTNVPYSMLSAMHVPMEDHRASDLPELTKPLFAHLNKVFKTTDGQSCIFLATGTAGWEVALTNTLSPGDKVLSARFGQFSICGSTWPSAWVYTWKSSRCPGAKVRPWIRSKSG
jgi:alanine-glyoxylate transaminase / serine-glyoxylate transaminase / serine-pyruvate transaminase